MRPRLYAILSDIHANYQALQAVAQDATKVAQGLQAESLRFIVLGDVVDYGPQPNECMAWVEQHADIAIQGNHDVDVAESVYQPPKTIQPSLWPITIWTRMILERAYKSRIRAWLPGMCKQNRPMPEGLEEFILFHSSLTSGHQGYIDNPRAGWDNVQQFRNGITYGLFGHSHVQGYFVDDPLRKRRNHSKTTAMTVVAPEDSELGTLNGSEHWEPLVLQRDPQQRGVGYTPWADLPAHPTLFNPGGVGQSRPHGTTKILAPHDNRAAYMLLKSNGRVQFQFRRTPYNVKETIRHLREDVTWPPPGYAAQQGSDILKEVEPNPFTADMWEQLMQEYRQTLRTMAAGLPELVEKVLVPQLQ